jgi:uncharacterized paraquat-inducible protein A
VTWEWPALAVGAAIAWIATGLVGRAKGSSFWMWFFIGAVLPYFGLVAALLYRREQEEPERRCPRCGKVQKLYAQVCMRCGTDLYLPEPADVRYPGATEARP